MTPWQEGFVKQCEARGINPSAVAKYAEDYSKGQKAAQRLLAKRAAAAKAAFDSMTPYQQGFAVRCHQRGLLAEKVAAYAMRKKAQASPSWHLKALSKISPEIATPEIGPTVANEADLLAARSSAAEAARAALESYDTSAAGEGEGYDQALLDAALSDVLAENDAADIAEGKREAFRDRMAPREELANEIVDAVKNTPRKRQARGLSPVSLSDRIADRLDSAGDTAGRIADEAVRRIKGTKAVQSVGDLIDQHSPEAIRARAALVGIDPENAPTDANILKNRAQDAAEDVSDWLGVQGRRIKGRALDAADKAKAKGKEYYGKAKAKGKEYYGKAKAKGKEVYNKGKDFLKTPRGKAVAAGGGAALTAALLGAYLLSRKKKKKAKK